MPERCRDHELVHHRHNCLLKTVQSTTIWPYVEHRGALLVLEAVQQIHVLGQHELSPVCSGAGSPLPIAAVPWD